MFLGARQAGVQARMRSLSQRLKGVCAHAAGRRLLSPPRLGMAPPRRCPSSAWPNVIASTSR